MTRSRTTRIAALATALLLPLALVACGGDGDDSAETVDRGSDQEETTTTAGSDGSTTTTDGDDGATTTTEGSDGSTTTTDGGGEPSSDLAAALLTVEDLPAGYTQDGEDDTTIDMGDEAGLCEGEVDVVLPAPVEQIERSFESADERSYLGSFVGRFDSDDAAAQLRWFEDEVERCSVEDPDGGTYTIEAIPGVGDEAVLLIGSDVNGSADVAVARVGDVLVGVSVFATPGASADVAALLALSVGRL